MNDTGIKYQLEAILDKISNHVRNNVCLPLEALLDVFGNLALKKVVRNETILNEAEAQELEMSCAKILREFDALGLDATVITSTVLRTEDSPLLSTAKYYEWPHKSVQETSAAKSFAKHIIQNDLNENHRSKSLHDLLLQITSSRISDHTSS